MRSRRHSRVGSRRRARQLRDVSGLATTIGREELDLLILLLRRAQEGQATYGHLRLKNDRRIFVWEALEEIVDCLFYLGAALLRQHKRSSASANRFRISNR